MREESQVEKHKPLWVIVKSNCRITGVFEEKKSG